MYLFDKYKFSRYMGYIIFIESWSCIPMSVNIYMYIVILAMLFVTDELLLIICSTKDISFPVINLLYFMK